MKNTPLRNASPTVKIPRQEFIDAYKEGLGIDGAEQLFKNTLKQMGLLDKHEYTREEALKICETLKKQTGFVGILAGILLSRFTIR